MGMGFAIVVAVGWCVPVCQCQCFGMPHQLKHYKATDNRNEYHPKGNPGQSPDSSPHIEDQNPAKTGLKAHKPTGRTPAAGGLSASDGSSGRNPDEAAPVEEEGRVESRFEMESRTAKVADGS